MLCQYTILTVLCPTVRQTRVIIVNERVSTLGSPAGGVASDRPSRPSEAIGTRTINVARTKASAIQSQKRACVKYIRRSPAVYSLGTEADTRRGTS